MSRVQLALNVTDIEAAVEFYTKLFGAGRGAGVSGALNHLGVEVETPEEVQAATALLSARGLEPEVQESTTCCYAVQDKAWVRDPDGAPWELYTVLADAPDETGLGCSTEACTPAEEPGGGGAARASLSTACC